MPYFTLTDYVFGSVYIIFLYSNEGRGAMKINQVWPEWQVDTLLGEGSFGKVYKVKRYEKNQTFYSAVKVLTVPKSKQEIKHARCQGMSETEVYTYFEGFVDDLLNEIVLMENLKGAQNIVGIDDYKIIPHDGEIGWDIFIRMELLIPFENFMSGADFSLKDVLKLGTDICTALEVCEQNNIIHRDIKPDNIFMSKFGEYKLGDFGIARELNKTQANLSKKGTLNYMAPEVYKGENYGKSVDIYSLGLVLYSLLNNNRMAFLPAYPNQITYNDNENALRSRLSGAALPYPCNASSSLGAVITKACAYRPEDRYKTASEFKNALLTEWAKISQSSINNNIPYVDYSPNEINRDMSKTTNDMTAHGKVIIDEYGTPTTVLNQSGVLAQTDIYANNDTQIKNGTCNTVNGEDSNFSLTKSKPKTSKLCHILAFPAAIAMIVILLVNSATGLELCFFILPTAVLLCGDNKVAAGLSAILFAVNLASYYFIDNRLYFEDALSSIHSGLIIVSMVLVILGGLAAVLQKEVRLAGMITVYSAILYIVAIILAGGFSEFELDDFALIYALFAATMVLWCYGYNSSLKPQGIKKITHYVTYAASAAFLIAGYISEFKS